MDIIKDAAAMGKEYCSNSNRRRAMSGGGRSSFLLMFYVYFFYIGLGSHVRHEEIIIIVSSGKKYVWELQLKVLNERSHTPALLLTWSTVQ